MAQNKNRMLAGFRNHAVRMQSASRANYRDILDHRAYLDLNPANPQAKNGLIEFQRMHSENADTARRYLFCVLALEAMD